MQLEKQVCSLELSKKLKILGVKQESLFWWNTKTDRSNEWVINPTPAENCSLWNQISAFTVAELGEMLPKSIKGQPLLIGFDETIWWITYKKSDRLLTESMNEADARAKMLIYLLENGLMGKERG